MNSHRGRWRVREQCRKSERERETESEATLAINVNIYVWYFWLFSFFLLLFVQWTNIGRTSCSNNGGVLSCGKAKRQLNGDIAIITRRRYKKHTRSRIKPHFVWSQSRPRRMFASSSMQYALWKSGLSGCESCSCVRVYDKIVTQIVYFHAV